MLALGISTVPLGTVHACSCAMPGGPAEVVASADVVFVGTVADTAAAPGETGPMIRHAFAVERASAETESLIEVQSLDDPGGAACGITFGVGERWLVAAYRDGATLQTNLCSGNQRTDEMPPAELAAYEELLSSVPEPADPSPQEVPGGVSPALVATAVAAVAGLALAAVLVVVIRAGRRHRA